MVAGLQIASVPLSEPGDVDIGERAVDHRSEFVAPVLPEERHDLRFDQVLLVLLEDGAQAVDARLDGCYDVLRQDLGQIVEQARVEVIVYPPPRSAAVEVVQEHHVGHEERMAQNRGARDARGPGPALLESELPDEVHEVERVPSGLELLHSDQVAVLLDLLLDLPAGLLDPVEGAVGIVYQVELPARGEIVRRADYPVLLGVLLGFQVCDESVPEPGVGSRNQAVVFGEDEFVDRTAPFRGYAVEHLGLQIRQY